MTMTRPIYGLWRQAWPRLNAEVRRVRRAVRVGIVRLVKLGNTKLVFIVGAILVALAVAFGATMRGVTAVGSTRTEGHAIPLQGATTARIDLTMESGELRLGRGDGGLLDAAFTYNVDAWEPEINYQVISREGVLRVEQGDSGGPFPVLYGDTVNVWDVVVGPTVPVDLRLDLGSADSTLVAAGLDLMHLNLTGDGGETVVDLSGQHRRNLDVHLQTGGGDVTLTLPSDSGVFVVVEADGGAVVADGLTAVGAALVNDRYGAAPFTVTVTVETDGGNVTLSETAPADNLGFEANGPRP